MTPATGWLAGVLPRRRPIPERFLPEREIRTAWQAVSLLLEYPSETLIGQLPAIRGAAEGLRDEVREPLVDLVDHLVDADLAQAQRLYVETFDHTRKCALHLTYYTCGDTRKRGVALVRFKQAYRRAGMEISEEELPDHLCVVLEFGALGDLDIGWRLVNEHRAGIEMLRLSLTERRSPWRRAIDALCATLPPLEGDQMQAVAQLLAEGPPHEDVGMDAYALDPRLNPHPDADEAELQGALS